jgi:hypothetical protein
MNTEEEKPHAAAPLISGFSGRYMGNKEFPTFHLATERRKRRAIRLAISDALHALRPQPPGPLIQRLIDESSESDTPESVTAKAKEMGYGT